MNKLEKAISNLSEEELKELFEEISEFRKTGTAADDAALRKLLEENSEDRSPFVMQVLGVSTSVLFEISKRYFK